MKVRAVLIFLSFAVALFYSCNQSPDTREELTSGDNNSIYTDPVLRPITIMEGKWSWIRTDGSGIAGPYVHDPLTVGYTLTYDFYDFTHLVIYRNDIKENEYIYQFNVSDSTAEQMLTLTDSTGNKMEYLWAVKDKDNDQFLELTNPIPCCDNDFTMIFKRLSFSVYVGK